MEQERIALKNLLEFLKEEIEGYEVMVLVNDRLVENLDMIISSSDRVLIVKENIGG